ncbi:arginine--tRNA ligase [Candidatus Uhrbacteria bacterium RIFCSPHIGHO2_01_FULL_63_20]|uniref:Arginine--tRNA ligase n=1 Tax=Candidatus Uhrbacteria bacterium RIFCSPHIGHO2_01_FULL_63_20 TaxID=1802385 RepID=A0A1F7TN36_9BACT|nr:MAG: arginine--tRNA ligase [Candidatus Uhrbacteria bacterium RIFCSPHIGHO2_01_FULL_63_20]
MSAFQDAKKQILLELKSAVGKEFTPTVADLTTPPDPSMGEVAFPCFALSKALKRSPFELASEIAAKVEPKGFVAKAVSAGPFVNFTLDPEALGKAVLADIAKEKDGYGRAEAAKSRVMVEFANPNTHKEVHVGHLRNFFVGQAVANLLSAAGFEVIPVSYINDLGTHVAKTLWRMKRSGEMPGKEDRIAFMGRMYAEAVREEEADPRVKEEISAIHRDLEELKGPYVSLWKKSRGWSLKELKAIFKELSLTIDKTYYESELIGETKRIVEELKANGIAKESQGAVIVDLEDAGLGVNLLVKSDGALLYNAKDLALAYRKDEDYRADRSLYVVDGRQSLALKQLFSTLKRAGFQKELGHVSYEFITLKEGAMSSRKGNIIRYETFRDSMLGMAASETNTRHPEWKERKVAASARAVAFAAIRFGVLKQDLDKKITFDMEEALSFDGFTGPYLLYSYARTKSILRKAGRAKKSPDASALSSPVERRILVKIASYPDVVHEAATGIRPSAIAQFLFDLCKAFAEFYETCPVLASEGATREARLALTAAVSQVLSNGLALLGIDTVEEM